MAKTDLTAARLREILDYNQETGTFTWKIFVSSHAPKGGVAGCKTQRGYVYIAMYKRKYLAHRLAWLYETGEWPMSLIDHIDGDPSNNAINNLRQATNSENLQNRKNAPAHSTTGLLGVWKNGRRFCAFIKVCGVRTYIGTFDTKEEAHSAYMTEKRKHHPFCTT